MKKLTVLIVLVVLAVSVLPAVSLRVGIGALSSLGASFNFGSWDLDADLRSTFPVVTDIGYPISSSLFDLDVSRKDWRKYSFGLFEGMTVGFSYRLVDSPSSTLNLGLAATAGIIKDKEDGLYDLIPNHDTFVLTSLSLQLRYTYNLNAHHGLFLSCGWPLASWGRLLGIEGNNDSYDISSWLFIPWTFREIERNDDREGLGKISLIMGAVASLRIGYIFTF
ncbi:MAG: hypothetical protein J6X41_04965 [Spirochaetales bacterium]|nr:hypothetical protein [Spirochaetales bacterium]